jgi:hypothetical protein
MTMPVRLNLEFIPPMTEPIVVSRTAQVGAVDHVRETIPAGDDVELPVHPADLDDLRLLVISSSAYGEALTYRVGGSTVDIVLDQPQVFHGAGMIGLLPTNPRTITVTNGLAVDVTVDVVAARSITP